MNLGTQRAKRWATAAVGADGETVAAMARRLGAGWRTIMRAVAEAGTPMVADEQRLAGVSGVGVDEHAWPHPSRSRGTQWATGIVNLTGGRPARLLDVVPGRSGASYADWLACRDPGWRQQIRLAALAPFRGMPVPRQQPRQHPLWYAAWKRPSPARKGRLRARG